MFAAVSLGIFDQLQSGPAPSTDLARRLHCDAGALERLLHACVSLGLLTRVEGAFSNTELSERYLVSKSPDTLVGYITYSNQSLFPLWGHLEDAVREGSNRWEQSFGARKGLFDHFFRSEDSQRSFLNGMHGFGRISSSTVVRTFDLSSFRRMCDLGGATGHLCLAACEAYPELTGIVFDLPAVERFAKEHIEGSPPAARVQFQSGDFFKDELPAADLYCVSRILHDWDEAKVNLLLRRMFQALPAGGGLLVAERLLSDDHSGPIPGLMQDLNMLIVTDGKERSCSEYKALFEAAGFRSIQCRRTGSIVDAILARKP